MNRTTVVASGGVVPVGGKVTYTRASVQMGDTAFTEGADDKTIAQLLRLKAQENKLVVDEVLSQEERLAQLIRHELTVVAEGARVEGTVDARQVGVIGGSVIAHPKLPPTTAQNRSTLFGADAKRKEPSIGKKGAAAEKKTLEDPQQQPGCQLFCTLQ